MKLSPQTVIYAIDLFGTASFAFSGALRVLDKRPDFVGMLILASATAVGGSVLRDVILNRDVMLLRDWGYPLAILFATLMTFFFPGSVARRQSIFKYFDAIGIGVFSAITASVAWSTTPTINPLSILMIACITGCAGGVIRDLMAGKTTLILSNELYVTPIIFGAAGLMIVQSVGGSTLAGFFTAMLVATGIRVLAIRFNWRLPRLIDHEQLPDETTSTQTLIADRSTHENNESPGQEKGRGRPLAR